MYNSKPIEKYGRVSWQQNKAINEAEGKMPFAMREKYYGAKLGKFDTR